VGLRLSQKDAEKFGLTDKKKSSKYRNKRTARGFDSKKEERRFDELVMLEANGVIKNLERQVRYRFEHRDIHICDYVADFVYVENQITVVEDVKSPMTRKLPAYRIKAKLMLAFFSIAIRET
jgi:hypothetical protein